MSGPRIVALAELGDPARLQPLAEAIFGAGDRRPDWFVRKLAREHVDPRLSQVATDGDADDPARWLGYVLVGTPPSRAPAARTSGTGVRADARGHGLGGALLHAAVTAAAHAGIPALELWAEHDRRSFYAAHGFVVRRTFETWLTFARGRERDELPTPTAFDRPGSRVVGEFLREAWEHADARHSFDHDGVLVHLAREGVAHAIHRILAAPEVSDAGIVAALDRVIERLPAAAPVLAIAIDRPRDGEAVSSITGSLAARLDDAGWRVVQRGHVMVRPIAAAVDNGRSSPR